MVATTKTTRGLIITIINYDKYQNPKNYETDNESHKRTTMERQWNDTINKNEKNGKNVNNMFLALATTLVRKAGYDVIELKTKKPDDKDTTFSDKFLIRNRIRNYIQSKGYRVSGDLLDGVVLDERITAILDKAIWRAKKNGRITIKSRDL